MHMYLFFCTNMIFFSFRDEYLWLTWNCPTNHTYSWSVGRNEASPDIAVQYHVSWHEEHHNVNDSNARRDSGTIKRNQRSIIADLSHSFSSSKMIARWYREKRHVIYRESLQSDPCFFSHVGTHPSRPLNQNSSNESFFQFPRHLGRMRIHRYTRVFVFAGRMKRRTESITWSGRLVIESLRIPWALEDYTPHKLHPSESRWRLPLPNMCCFFVKGRDKQRHIHGSGVSGDRHHPLV